MGNIFVITYTAPGGAIYFVTANAESIELSNQIGDARKISGGYYYSALFDLNATLDKHKTAPEEREKYSVENYGKFIRRNNPFG